MDQYFTVLTAIGSAKLANATALGQNLTLTELSVGDGANLPVQTQTALQNEHYRTPINQIYIDSNNANWLVVESLIPETVGGWTVREVGLWDDDGDLIAIGNYPETYKPQLSEGAGRDLYIRTVIEVGSASEVTLKIDPAIVLATRKFVDDENARQYVDLKSGRKNIIVDGRFDYWFEGTSQTSNGYGSSTMSRYYLSGSTMLATRENLVAGVDLPCVENPTAKYYKRIVTNAGGGGSDYVSTAFKIEDVRSCVGKNVLSFYIRTDIARNFAIEIKQFFGTGGSSSEVKQFSISSSSEFTRVDLVVDFGSLAGKTITDDSSVLVEFFFDAGNTRIPVHGVSQSGTFDIACVQLEEGAIATKFEEEGQQESLERVNRYYQKSLYFNEVLPDIAFIGAQFSESNPNQCHGVIGFGSMRATPAVTIQASDRTFGSFGVLRTGSVVAPTALNVTKDGTLRMVAFGKFTQGLSVQFDYELDARL